MPAKTFAGASFARPGAAPIPNTAAASFKPLLAFNAGTPGAVPAITTEPIGMGSFRSANNSDSRSWMSDKGSPGKRTGGGPAAPAVDTSSFSGIGENHAKPTIVDASTGRDGKAKGKTQGEGPKPIAARTGPAPGDVLAVLPKLASPVGNPDGGRGNPDPNHNAKERPQVGAGDPDPDFTEYLRKLQLRIRRAWMPPRQPNSKSTVIIFTIGVNGELLSTRMQRSSGESAMDDAAMQAIRNSAPFPHLPQYATDSVDVQFTFDYNVFGGGGLRQF